MYLGEVVEHGAKADVLTTPRHPYTRALMASLPGRGQGRQATIPGTVPTLEERPPGCAFAPRCAFARPGLCDVERPVLLRSDGVDVRCHAFGDAAPMFDLTMRSAQPETVTKERITAIRRKDPRPARRQQDIREARGPVRAAGARDQGRTGCIPGITARRNPWRSSANPGAERPLWDTPLSDLTGRRAAA